MSNGIHEHLTVLSEPLRTRILRVLEADESGISVGELARVLVAPQSTVSRHLKVLDQAGWLSRTTAGPASLLRIEVPYPQLWAVVRDEAATGGLFDDDLRRLEAVVALRSQNPNAFFGRVAGRWDEVRKTLYGTGFLVPTLLGLLDPKLVVADLGCGTGETVATLAPYAKKVIGVDRESAMLEHARIRTAAFDEVELREGDLTALPIRSGEVDAALCTLVLHLVPEIDRAFGELRRILAPEGVVVLTDLQPHDQEDLRATMGHAHSGFSEADVRRLAKAADLQLRSYRPLEREEELVGPPLFVAVLKRR